MPDAFAFGIAKRRLEEEDDSEGAMVMLKDATDAAKTAANNTTTTWPTCMTRLRLYAERSSALSVVEKNKRRHRFRLNALFA